MSVEALSSLMDCTRCGRRKDSKLVTHNITVSVWPDEGETICIWSCGHQIVAGESACKFCERNSR